MAEENENAVDSTTAKPIEEARATIAVSDATIRNMIYTVRDEQVMLDSDLAELYGVETRTPN